MEMQKAEVLIVGAGAAGLMAAYTLAKSGTKVTVLEARSRLGGRIHTLTSCGFSGPVELGAEFIHGNLPVTLSLLKEAGVAYRNVDFSMWYHNQNGIEERTQFIEGWDVFFDALCKLETDMPLQDFMMEYFSGAAFATLRNDIENYVAGYDTADINDVSAFALRAEWSHEDTEAQYRIHGGYTRLINYLAEFVESKGGSVRVNEVVTTIEWQENNVKVHTGSGRLFNASKLIIAAPLGVLQSPVGTEGALVFMPPLAEQDAAIHNIGFGAIIKMLLEFDAPFWEESPFNISNLGFLFSDQLVPTFWTQSPDKSTLLTGWLGGPPALVFKAKSADEILEITISSLSNIFATTPLLLKKRLKAWHIADWTAEPYTRGSYAYDKPGSAAARTCLLQGVANTVFFAGEYLYSGAAMGTVEAALTSGQDAALLLLKQLPD